MKVKQALDLLVRDCPAVRDLLNVFPGSKVSDFHLNLHDDLEFDHAGTYLSVWKVDKDIRPFLSMVEGLTGVAYADFEVPTLTGAYLLFELEDYEDPC